jgi:hypothetical protein
LGWIADFIISSLTPSQLRYFDEVVIKRCAGADVRQRLRHSLIDIRSPRTQLVPPDRKRNSDPRLYAIRYSRYQLALTSVVPYAHRVAVLDSASSSVVGVELDERLALAL